VNKDIAQQIVRGLQTELSLTEVETFELRCLVQTLLDIPKLDAVDMEYIARCVSTIFQRGEVRKALGKEFCS
jgi:hypothetical protein